jgi:hypothetical protein
MPLELPLLLDPFLALGFPWGRRARDGWEVEASRSLAPSGDQLDGIPCACLQS